VSAPLLEGRCDGRLDGGFDASSESLVRSASSSGVPLARHVASDALWQRGQTASSAASGEAHAGQVGTGELYRDSRETVTGLGARAVFACPELGEIATGSGTRGFRTKEVGAGSGTRRSELGEQ
jgi:hypothetical protein